MTLFIAIDGDDVGPAIRNFIIRNEVDRAAQLSVSLRTYFENIARQLTESGAMVAFYGGDSVLARIDEIPTTKDLERFYFVGPCTVSIGIGETSEIAYLALQLAKARGKNQVVLINGIQQQTIFCG